jgi:hypothetical protein
MCEFCDIALRHSFFLVELSNSLRLFKRAHLEPDEVLREGWNLIEVFRFDDSSWNGGEAEVFTGRESSASGDESPAPSVPCGYDDRLQKAVGFDRLRELVNAFFRDALAKCGAVHVDLIDVHVLFHQSSVLTRIFARVVRA